MQKISSSTELNQEELRYEVLHRAKKDWDKYVMKGLV